VWARGEDGEPSNHPNQRRVNLVNIEPAELPIADSGHQMPRLVEGWGVHVPAPNEKASMDAQYNDWYPATQLIASSEGQEDSQEKSDADH
jgi:hypothetical protein